MGHKKRNVPSRFKTPSSCAHAPPSPAVSGGGGGPATDGIPSSSESEKTLISNSPMDQQQQSKIEPLVVESDGSAFSAIKLECERALTWIRSGNHTKALRLMKEMSLKHENSALIHRDQGTVCVKVTSIIDDPNAKRRHLKNAIDSARKLVLLWPNSIEFAHFYTNLLYEAASDGNDYEEVVQECERAVGIENPVDPAKESLQDEKEQKY